MRARSFEADARRKADVAVLAGLAHVQALPVQGIGEHGQRLHGERMERTAEHAYFGVDAARVYALFTELGIAHHLGLHRVVGIGNRLFGFARLAQARHEEALRVAHLGVQAPDAFTALRSLKVEIRQVAQRFEDEPQLLAGEEHLLLVLLHVRGAGGIDHHAARAQEAVRLAQELLLQTDERADLVVLPDIHDLGVLLHRAPAGAGRVELYPVPRFIGQGELLAALTAGDDLRKAHDVHIAAQIGKAHRRGLVAQNHALRTDEPCELAGL